MRRRKQRVVPDAHSHAEIDFVANEHARTDFDANRHAGTDFDANHLAGTDFVANAHAGTDFDAGDRYDHHSVTASVPQTIAPAPAAGSIFGWDRRFFSDSAADEGVAQTNLDIRAPRRRNIRVHGESARYSPGICVSSRG